MDGLGRVFVEKVIDSGLTDAVNASYLGSFQLFLLDELEYRQMMNLQNFSHLFSGEDTLRHVL